MPEAVKKSFSYAHVILLALIAGLFVLYGVHFREWIEPLAVAALIVVGIVLMGGKAFFQPWK